ncbi:MAG: hypothetical protein OXB86_05250 [Bdellovibrionales bacterium]|nr:hypothetical protein [Bdellovibrionales bacterium]
MTILFVAFMYGEAIAQPLMDCEEAFASFAQTIVLAKSADPQKIQEALDRGAPLSLLEDTKDDLTSKGWFFPSPLGSDDPKAIHHALNRGAVTVTLKSSITPEIGYKVGNAILAKNYGVTRFFSELMSFIDIYPASDFNSFSWGRSLKRAFVKTGKISKAEINQFEQELYQVILELKQIISVADDRNIILEGFAVSETQNHFLTRKSGHNHSKDNNGEWISATYTVYGPAGTLFETEDGQPSATFPGQVLLLSERKRNREILKEEKELTWHATPHFQKRRLVIIFGFKEKS